MQRFTDKINFGGNPRLAGCWEWTAHKRNGYGRFWLDGENRQAHRVSYELFVGPISEGLDVRHKCDNPGCVNPNHLEVGTHSENMGDKVRKGRQYRPKGELHHHAKLTAEQVEQIRNETGTQREIAERFGVSQPTVSMIKNGRTWQ